jgi:hypothetical protein
MIFFKKNKKKNNFYVTKRWKGKKLVWVGFLRKKI